MFLRLFTSTPKSSLKFRTTCHYSTVSHGPKKRTPLDFKEKYSSHIPLTMVTAYDYTSAVFADKAGIDSLLVGDSFSMVMCGHDSTSRATVDEVVYHCKAVARGAPSSFIVADMPFGSYEINSEDAVRNAIRLVKEGNANAVKLEGGKRMASRVKSIVEAGIPVMGHIGLTPQTLNVLGGFRVQGKTAEAAVELTKDAQALEEAGCYALVIESVPQRIAEYITEIVKIPTIGIGAGNKTSGQILVWHDMFGLFQDFTPKFCKQYAHLGQAIQDGLARYRSEVESRNFPEKQHTYLLKQEEWDKFREIMNITTVSVGKMESPEVRGTTGTVAVDMTTGTTGMTTGITGMAAGTTGLTTGTMGLTTGTMGMTTGTTGLTTGTTGLTTGTTGIMTGTVTAVMTLGKVPTSMTNDPPGTNGTLVALGTNGILASSVGSETVFSVAESKFPPLPHVFTHVDSSQRKKKIVVVGGGAMGSLVAGRLALSNMNSKSPFLCDVWILSSWEEHIHHINQNGLVIEELDEMKVTTQPGETLVKSIRATSSVADVVADGRYPDLVVILVKCPNTPKAAEKTKNILEYFPKKKTTVLTLQNGLGNLEIISDIVGPMEGVEFIQAVTDQGAQILGPARVRHTGQGYTTVAGEPSNPDHKALLDILNSSGMNAIMNPDVESVTWGKLVLNAAINPITALLGLENGQLVDGTNSRARSMLMKALNEAVLVASARGIRLPYSDPLQKVESVARKTAKNKSSMLVDMLRGEPTEIEAINGVIVREGAKLGIDVGMNSFLLKNVKNCLEPKRYIPF